jgi:hypothetical protein
VRVELAIPPGNWSVEIRGLDRSHTMSDKPGWRQAYDAAERSVAPRAEALVHSEEFAHATAVIARAQRVVGRQVRLLALQLDHQVNQRDSD